MMVQVRVIIKIPVVKKCFPSKKSVAMRKCFTLEMKTIRNPNMNLSLKLSKKI